MICAPQESSSCEEIRPAPKAVVPSEERIEDAKAYLRLDLRSLKNVFQSSGGVESGMDEAGEVVFEEGVTEAAVDAWRQRDGVKKEDVEEGVDIGTSVGFGG